MPGAAADEISLICLRHGFEVCAVDQDENAVDLACGGLPQNVAPDLSAANFRVAQIEAMPFADSSADVAISSAVLHFARDDAHFHAMLQGTWRVLKPGGLLFCRLASSIGIESKIRQISGRRYALPDGSERYLVDEEMLLQLTQQLGARLADPLKTTVVQDQREP